MINKVILTGRLASNTDLRYTPKEGKAVGRFALAVERTFKDSEGERQTDFIHCIIWGKRAESLAEYSSKGSLLAVEGRLQVRKFEDKEGNTRYVTEVIISNFQLLESKAISEQRRQATNSMNENPDGEKIDEIPDWTDDEYPF